MKNLATILKAVLILAIGIFIGISINSAIAQRPTPLQKYKYECQHIQLGWEKGVFLNGSGSMNIKGENGWKLITIIEAPNSGTAPDKQKDYILVWEQPK